MARAYEMTFRIGGNLAGSFSNTFSKATSSLTNLRNQSRQTQRALDQLGNDFRKGKIHQSQYAESTERLTRELKQLEDAQNRINTFKTTFGNGLNTVRTSASIAAVGTAVAATGLALNSVNKAAEFEQQMTKVGVIAGATETDIKKLNETALELGASSSLSATEVSVAMKELASKGMDTNKIIGAMPGILAAAESSGEDLALTSDVVTSALNAFELKATDSSHVADVMAMSANKTAAGVEDLGYSFKYAAPIVKTLGGSLEELAAATGIMVDKGQTGEQAGTSLRMALTRLSKPPKEARKALDKLGISVVDKNKKFKSLAQISEDWNKATKDLTDTQKVSYAATVFGTEAATGMLNLFSAGPQKINEMTKALENSAGTAKNAAKSMKDNYGGSLEELKGSIESAQIKFASPILPVFQDVFDGLSSTIDGNMGGIEKTGERVAAALKDILDPFSTQKPTKPKLSDSKNIGVYKELLAQYQIDQKKYNKFGHMDFGDKVVYMLDEATEKIEKWLSGSGGDNMNKIFTKLGEIAAKAWLAAFESSIKSTGSNLMNGNFAASLGMGSVAWMLGGGLMVRGAIGTGKWGMDKLKNRSAAKGASSTKSIVPNAVGSTETAAATATRTVKPSTITGVTTSSSKTLQTLGKVSKVLGKVAMPLTIAAEGYNIYKAQDKTKATVQAAGGIGGSLAGAKIGAAIGTAILPGIGSAIGGVLGGIGGYAAGRWAAGKGTDAVRGNTTTTTSSPKPVSYEYQIDTSAISSSIQQTTKSLSLLTMYTGQACNWVVGAFTGIKSSADNVKFNVDLLTTYTGQASGWVVGAFNGINTSAGNVIYNLDLLTSYSGQACGWLASLNGIQTAGEKVVKALNNLEARINNVQLPSTNKRVSYNG